MSLARILKVFVTFQLLFISVGLHAAQAVVLQLPWYHQFQFAGYYAAQAQGYFEQEDIEVDIRAGMSDHGEAHNPVEEVVFQRAQFGVTRSDLLVHHARGLPVVMLATIMQRTPASFITLDKYHIQRLEDISDKPVSLPLNADEPGNVIDIEVIATLARAGIVISQLNNRIENWNLDSLTNGKTNVILGFATDEPYILQRRGYNPVVITPMDYGIDLYGDLLFTNESTLRTEPELVEKFRRASLKGWEYAMKHPREIAEFIVANYSLRNSDYDIDFLLHEAESMKKYIQPELIEIGYSNKGRWKRILAIYRDIGITDPVDLDQFLYQPIQEHILERTFWLIASMVIAMMVVIGWLMFVRLKLVDKVRHSEQRESQLRLQAETDPLTGLVNRRRFSLELDVSYLRASQEKTPLCVLMLDVDHFKDINDKYGHLAGDKVLCSLAHLCKGVIRHTDVLCRYGGEEFAFLLPGSSMKHAMEISKRLIEAVREDIVYWEGETIEYRVSIGVSELIESDKDGVELISRTDRNLYRAKATGRDTICFE